jgi:hypothetical protein
VKDIANNIEYAVSSNKLNIKVLSDTMPVSPPLMPILTGATLPIPPFSSGTISQT